MVFCCRANDTEKPGGRDHSTFLSSKTKKKGNKEKKERILKKKILNGCDQGQNVTFLAILEGLEFKKKILSANHSGQPNFPVFHGPSTLKSISPALY